MRKLKLKTMNKKGNAWFIIIFFVILFAILFVGFITVIASSIINWVADETVPGLTTLGSMDGVNLTQSASAAINPINTLVQSLTWMTGMLYMIMLIGSVAMAFILRASPNKWLIGFYFVLAILLVMVSILVSNAYQDMYEEGDDLSIRLKEHTLLSWMILYSPMVMTLIVFITGIIIFSGLQTEEF